MTTTPTSIEGLGLPYLENEQTIGALELIISLFNSQLPSAWLLKEMIEYLQLEIGSASLAFYLSFSAYSIHTTPCWIRSL